MVVGLAVAAGVALGGDALGTATVDGAAVAPVAALPSSAPLPAPSVTLARPPPPDPPSRPPPTTVPATTVVLPTPAPVPLEARAIEPAVVLGTIEIPRLGLSVDLHEGISLNTIDRGPSHWPGTAMPGHVGNVVVAGHRVTETRPFRHIDQLQVGDEVVFTVAGERSVYRVTGHEVVPPDALHIADQTPEPVATLFACHPPGSARYRYVVRAALEGTPAP